MLFRSLLLPFIPLVFSLSSHINTSIIQSLLQNTKTQNYSRSSSSSSSSLGLSSSHSMNNIELNTNTEADTNHLNQYTQTSLAIDPNSTITVTLLCNTFNNTNTHDINNTTNTVNSSNSNTDSSNSTHIHHHLPPDNMHGHEISTPLRSINPNKDFLDDCYTPQSSYRKPPPFPTTPIQSHQKQYQQLPHQYAPHTSQYYAQPMNKVGPLNLYSPALSPIDGNGESRVQMDFSKSSDESSSEYNTSIFHTLQSQDHTETPTRLISSPASSLLSQSQSPPNQSNQSDSHHSHQSHQSHQTNKSKSTNPSLQHTPVKYNPHSRLHYTEEELVSIMSDDLDSYSRLSQSPSLSQSQPRARLDSIGTNMSFESMSMLDMPDDDVHDTHDTLTHMSHLHAPPHSDYYHHQQHYQDQYEQHQHQRHHQLQHQLQHQHDDDDHHNQHDSNDQPYYIQTPTPEHNSHTRNQHYRELLKQQKYKQYQHDNLITPPRPIRRQYNVNAYTDTQHNTRQHQNHHTTPLMSHMSHMSHQMHQPPQFISSEFKPGQLSHHAKSIILLPSKFWRARLSMRDFQSVLRSPQLSAYYS